MWTLLWLACSGGGDGNTDGGGSTTPDTATEQTDTGGTGSDSTDTGSVLPFAPDLPIGGCGMADYALIGPEKLGEVLSVEKADDLSMSAAAIGITLQLAGVPPDRFELPYDVETWRVRYTTQDRGELVEVTMLLSFPVGAGSVPVVMWGHGTTGFMDECAPSAMGLEGGAQNLLFGAMGYVVASPDYIGMVGFGEPSGQLHPYIVPEAAAFAALDSVRATWAFQQETEGLTSEASQEAIWAGGSEGGFHALWADRYQPHYLPEAEGVAVLASVPPADIPGILEDATQTFSDGSGGLVGAMVAWDDWYGFDSLDGLLVDPLDDELPVIMASTCDFDIEPEPTSVEEIFTPGFRDAVAQGELETAFPDVHCAAAKAQVATSEVPLRSDTPVLYIVAELDELVLAEPTREAFPAMCDAGYRMNYIECAGAEHTEGGIWSLGQAVDWINDRVDGVPMVDVCVQGAPEVCDLQKALE